MRNGGTEYPTGFWKRQPVDTSGLSKNCFAPLFPDDGTVDHVNTCDPVFMHIGPKADNTVVSNEQKQEKVSESIPSHKKERKEVIGATTGLPMIQVEIQTVDTGAKVIVEALLDSGATTCFIDEKFAKDNNLNLIPLACAIPIYNVDGCKG